MESKIQCNGEGGTEQVVGGRVHYTYGNNWMSFSYGIGVKEKWQAKDVSNYKALNKVTTKYQYLLPFCEFFFKK